MSKFATVYARETDVQTYEENSYLLPSMQNLQKFMQIYKRNITQFLS
jgi:hypothetical protein